jgi:hypothetical protein
MEASRLISSISIIHILVVKALREAVIFQE